MIKPIFEIWRPVRGYEGLYEVSNRGRVRNTKTGRILKLQINRHGYVKVGLTRNGKQRLFSVHRLVYETFVGEIPEGMQIDHISGDKTFNNIANLRCVTPKENINNPRTRKKVLARYESEEYKNYLKKVHGMRFLDQEYRENHRKRMQEITSTDEWREKNKRAMKILHADPEYRKRHLEGTRRGRNKPVLQIDKLTDGVIREWECAADVERELGFDKAKISSCCNGKKYRHTAYGFKWRFK